MVCFSEGMPELNNKGVVHILVLIILLVGFAASFYLVNYTKTNLKPKANEDAIIQIVDDDGNPLAETDNPNVRLKIKLPPGWVLPGSQTNNNSNGFIKEANAQEKICPADENFNGLRCDFNPPQSANPPQCSTDYNWCDDYCCRKTSASAAPPALTKYVVRSFRKENIDQDGSSGGSQASTLDYQDLGLRIPLAWTLNSLKEDQNEAIRQVQITFYDKAAFYVNKGEQSNQVSYQTSVKLTPPTPSPSSLPSFTPSLAPASEPAKEYYIELHIHDAFSDRGKVESWVRDTIENYVNPEFRKAGINKKLKVTAVLGYSGSQCPQDISFRTNCEFNPYGSIIHVWIYPLGYKSEIKKGGLAYPATSGIGINLPAGKEFTMFGQVDRQLLAHEIMHIFSAPDYYLEYVSKEKNNVSHMEITPAVKDVMYWFNQDWNPLYSWTTKEYASKVKEIPFIKGRETINMLEEGNPRGYIPWKTILEITDDQKQPLEGLQVLIYPQIIDYQKMDFVISSSQTILDGFTDKQGRFDLGDGYNLLKPNKSDKKDNYWAHSVLVQVTKGDQVHYMAITRSYLNTLFFQGKIQEAVISVPFSQMVEYNPNEYHSLSVPGVNIPEPELPKGQKELMDYERIKYIEETLNLMKQQQ